MNEATQLDVALIAQAVGTLGMVGAIWLVQLAHYPLQIHVDRSQFVDYQQAHMHRITYVVGPLMLAEAAAAAWLLFLPMPEPGVLLAWIGMGLVLLLWGSTLVLQVPCHWKLERGWDEPAYRRLVATNWVRTVGWTARGVVACWMLLL
ncbi:MAG TPA: hypothetical protein DEO57_08610 [Phycisphaerales bacterium]|nr:hypothetical protein [Phycisphaerales bacterium]|tara:strand:+ start:221 stop:664 length:444 start_codon:yes stop_codon:yes gene_type:complete